MVLESSVKPSQESPVDGKLAFLDTCVHILEDGGTKVTVYRKPTHTDQYLGFESHHPLEHKRSVVRTLLHRVKTIVSTQQDQRSEKEHVLEALRANGYKNWMFNIPQKPLPLPTTTTEGADTTAAYRRSIGIPYCRGLSEHLQRIFKSHNIQVYHQPWNTLHSMLVHPKDPVEMTKKCGVVSCD